MDEMKLKLSTFFMRDAASKIISKTAKNKLGYDVDVKLNGFDIETIDGKAHVHINLDAEMNMEDIKKLIKKLT